MGVLTTPVEPIMWAGPAGQFGAETTVPTVEPVNEKVLEVEVEVVVPVRWSKKPSQQTGANGGPVGPSVDGSQVVAS